MGRGQAVREQQPIESFPIESDPIPGPLQVDQCSTHMVFILSTQLSEVLAVELLARTTEFLK